MAKRARMAKYSAQNIVSHGLMLFVKKCAEITCKLHSSPYLCHPFVKVWMLKKRFDKKYRMPEKKVGKKLAGIKKTIYLCPRNGTDTRETHSHRDYGMSHEKASEKRGGTPKRSLKE